MIEGCLGPRAGDGGENAQRATPVLEQELVGGDQGRNFAERPHHLPDFWREVEGVEVIELFDGGHEFGLAALRQVLDGDPREQGVTFGVYQGLGSLARVAGPIIAGAVYPFLRNTGAFAVSAIIALLAGLWTLALRRPAPGPAAPDAMPQAAIEHG